MNQFVAPFTVADHVVDQLAEAGATPTSGVVATAYPDHPAQHLAGLLDQAQVSVLLDHLRQQPWQAVGLDGIAANFSEGDPVGSYRASCYTERLADMLWERLRPYVGARDWDAQSPTDLDGARRWRPVGVNPLMRFIAYRPGGLLVPHYDAPYESPEGRRTLTSVVLYVDNDGAVGGATRFLDDPQQTVPRAQRDHSDRVELARDEEIVSAIAGAPGDALLFDHRVLHDSQPLRAGDKMIMRTDVMYEPER